MAVINPLVEGDIDEAVAIRLIQHSGHDAGITYGRRGIGYIREKLPGFNRSAKSIRYLTLVDFMDTGIECPPNVMTRWLPHPEQGMQLRVVVREIESWLLADADGLAMFLSVRPALISSAPEAVQDPKQLLVNIARRSRKRTTRAALVPSNESTAQVGPRYNSELRAFVENHWSPVRASHRAPSLAKCIQRLAAIPV